MSVSHWRNETARQTKTDRVLNLCAAADDGTMNPVMPRD